MKFGISSTGGSLDSQMDQRFGRAAFFIIADTESSEIEIIDNSAAMAAGGAGITAGQTMTEKGIKALITGNVGPNAMNVLNAAEIKIYKGTQDTIKSNIEDFKNGKLKEISTSVDAHYGMNLTGGGK